MEVPQECHTSKLEVKQAVYKYVALVRFVAASKSLGSSWGIQPPLREVTVVFVVSNNTEHLRRLRIILHIINRLEQGMIAHVAPHSWWSAGKVPCEVFTWSIPERSEEHHDRTITIRLSSASYLYSMVLKLLTVLVIWKYKLDLPRSITVPSTRWAPTSCKRSYTPYNGLIKSYKCITLQPL